MWGTICESPSWTSSLVLALARAYIKHLTRYGITDDWDLSSFHFVANVYSFFEIFYMIFVIFFSDFRKLQFQRGRSGGIVVTVNDLHWMATVFHFVEHRHGHVWLHGLARSIPISCTLMDWYWTLCMVVTDTATFTPCLKLQNFASFLPNQCSMSCRKTWHENYIWRLNIQSIMRSKWTILISHYK